MKIPFFIVSLKVLLYNVLAVEAVCRFGTCLPDFLVMLVQMQLCFDLHKSEYARSITRVYGDDVNLLVVSK